MFLSCSVKLVCFLGVLGFDESFKVGEAELPEIAILIEPAIDGAQGFRIQLIDAMPALAVFAYQMRTPEKAKVFGDGGAGNGESSGNFSGWLTAAPQQIQHCPAGGVG
jgi:hypothetical protein